MARTIFRRTGAVYSRESPAPTFGMTSQLGFSLFELLFVITIIGLLSIVIQPSLGPGEGIKLDLAAMEVADSLRFARSEALRLGVARGVSQQSIEKRFRVFSMDTLTSPATLVYDVYHPVDKQFYDRQLGQAPFAFGGDITRTPSFRGTCNAPEDIYFDADGIPWCADPDDVLLNGVTITLTLGADTRTVLLYGISGRVVIQ